MKLHTSINCGGNCRQAFRFYEQHLGRAITMMVMHSQQPNADDVPPEREDAVLHARISLAGTEVMGSDVPPDRFQPMRGVYLSLTANSIEEAGRLYALLSDEIHARGPSVRLQRAAEVDRNNTRYVNSYEPLAHQPQAERQCWSDATEEAISTFIPSWTTSPGF